MLLKKFWSSLFPGGTPSPAVRHAGRRWLWIAAIAAVGVAAIYLLAVWTETGQVFENAALAGGKADPDNPIAVSDTRLRIISIWSLIAATLLVGIIGLRRGGLPLAAAGTGTIGVSLFITEVLKHYVLPRPDLTGAADIAHNSFPSGHTTIAMSWLFAVIIVLPYRWRGFAMVVLLTWATGFGALTVSAEWHRLSDTLGANLVVLGVASVASWYLASQGEVREAGPKRPVFRVAFYIFWLIAGILILGVGVLLGALNYAANAPSDQEFLRNAFLSAYPIAAGAGILTALAFWASWHGLTSGRVTKRQVSA